MCLRERVGEKVGRERGGRGESVCTTENVRKSESEGEIS